MKPKTMIALMTALAACVIFLVLRKSFHGRLGRERGVPPSAGLFMPAPVGARELTITSAAGRKWVFAKADGHWQIAEPVRAKADDSKVNEVVDALIFCPATVVEGEDAVDNETTGLDSPFWTMTLTDERGRSYNLAIGQAAPMSGGSRTYVRDPSSKQVFVATFDFAAKLSQPVGEFRDKALWDIRQSDVRRVAIAGRESYELVRAGQGWQVATRAFRAAADADKVRLLLDKLAFLTIGDFVTDEPASLTIYGLDNPRLAVTLEVVGKPGPATAPATATAPSSTEAATQATQATQPASPQAVQVHTLALGAATNGKVYAKLTDSPTIFQLPAALLEDLQPHASDLRDRRLLRLGDRGVRGVEIQLPSSRTVLVEKDGRWEMEHPFAGPANSAAVKDLLSRLESLQAASFVDDVTTLAAFGLEPPRGTITLHVIGGDRPVRLLLGGPSPSGEMTFVQSDQEAFVAAVRTAEARSLLEGPAAYWDTKLLEVPTDEKAEALEVRRDEEIFVLAVNGAGEWAMSKPIAAPAEEAAVADLVAALRDVSARKIVALDRMVPDKFTKAKGLVTTKLTTTVRRSESPAATRPSAIGQPSTSAASSTTGPAAPAETRTYTVHAVELDGTVYTWVENGPPAAVGEMEPALLEKLTAELRRRDVGLRASGEVEEIQITLDDLPLVLCRRDSAWRCQADPHVGISQVKVDAFLRNARLLKAQRFVVHRGPPKGFGLDKPHLIVEIAPTGEPACKLVVSAIGPEGTPERYASCSAVEGVFLLTNQAVQGLSKRLDDFKN